MTGRTYRGSLATFTDLYQLTMMYGYWKTGKLHDRAIFDLYFRRNPFQNGFVIAAGLEQAIQYLQDLRFHPGDLAYLASLGLFEDRAFFDELTRLRFTGDLWAVPEGTVVFPQEPLLRVEGPLFEVQLIETALLNMVGFQSLIATKANRIVRSALGRPVMEFGARRAQEPDAAVMGARAAIIGGCVGTSNVLAGQLFGIQVMGTHAHSWVMTFPDELTAFRAYAEAWPHNLTLLVDTYDVLRSGVPNAITVFHEVLARSETPPAMAIRLDSGDLAYLSKQARSMLDDAGLPKVKIVASNDLDDDLIRELQAQDAQIDMYGVGTNLITAAQQPALGCVYKLVAEWSNGAWVPRIKRSANVEKITTPGKKQVIRYRDRDSGQAVVDLVVMADETPPTPPFEVFHPVYTFKRKTVDHVVAEPLLVPVMTRGRLTYQRPKLPEIAAHAEESLAQFPAEVKRFANPHEYHVDLSERVWNTKEALLRRSAQIGGAHPLEGARP